MIYKFKKENINLEVEQTNEETVTITLYNDEEGDDNVMDVGLHKSDIFKLIGALHLLHKEMK